MATKTVADVFVSSHSWADHEVTYWDNEEGWAKVVEFESGWSREVTMWHATTRDGLDMLVTYWPFLDGQYTVDVHATPVK